MIYETISIMFMFVLFISSAWMRVNGNEPLTLSQNNEVQRFVYLFNERFKIDYLFCVE